MANNIRVIKYIPKTTSARTQYREIDAEDMSWLQTEMVRWLAVANEMGQRRDEDAEYFNRHWWTKRSQNLPKGQHGPNSPASFIGGTVNNLVFGTQRDLSDRQMDSIETISTVMGQAFEGASQIRFQIGF